MHANMAVAIVALRYLWSGQWSWVGGGGVEGVVQGSEETAPSKCLAKSGSTCHLEMESKTSSGGCGFGLCFPWWRLSGGCFMSGCYSTAAWVQMQQCCVMQTTYAGGPHHGGCPCFRLQNACIDVAGALNGVVSSFDHGCVHPGYTCSSRVSWV